MEEFRWKDTESERRREQQKQCARVLAERERFEERRKRNLQKREAEKASPKRDFC